MAYLCMRHVHSQAPAVPNARKASGPLVSTGCLIILGPVEFFITVHSRVASRDGNTKHTIGPYAMTL